jgi:hypothetical protein
MKTYLVFVKPNLNMKMAIESALKVPTCSPLRHFSDCVGATIQEATSADPDFLECLHSGELFEALAPNLAQQAKSLLKQKYEVRMLKIEDKATDPASIFMRDQGFHHLKGFGILVIRL